MDSLLNALALAVLAWALTLPLGSARGTAAGGGRDASRDATPPLAQTLQKETDIGAWWRSARRLAP